MSGFSITTNLSTWHQYADEKVTWFQTTLLNGQ